MSGPEVGAAGARHPRGTSAPGTFALLAVFLTALAVTWVAIVVAAPTALAHGRLPVLTLGAYEIGGRICHQRPERSFHVSGIQMPVCARCFGLYLSGAVGLALAWALRPRRPGRAMRLALGIAALPIAVSVALEWMGLIATSNVTRLVTGLPLGFVAGLVVVGALRSSSDHPGPRD